MNLDDVLESIMDEFDLNDLIIICNPENTDEIVAGAIIITKAFEATAPSLLISLSQSIAKTAKNRTDSPKDIVNDIIGGLKK